MTPERLEHITDPDYRAAVQSAVADLLSGQVSLPAPDDPRLLQRWQLQHLGLPPPPGWDDPLPWALRTGYVYRLCRALSRRVCGEPESDRDRRFRESYPPEQVARFRPEVVLCLRAYDPTSPSHAAARLEAVRARRVFRGEKA